MRTRRHALGQNFLHHKPTIQKILETVAKDFDRLEAAGRPAKSLLEVGPGKLALTHGLSDLAKGRGMPLVLVERDRYLEEGLRESSPESELHFFDAATEKLTALIDELEAGGKTPLYFASNLPYSASSQILARLCHNLARVAGATVMVQKELADRMMAPAGGRDRGALSLLIQSYFRLEKAFDVGPGAFTPPPKVMSTVLRLVPLEQPEITRVASPLKFEAFCKGLFSQRRKMIRNLIPPEKHDSFAKLGISGTERPEVLDLDTILNLYRVVAGE